MKRIKKDSDATSGGTTGGNRVRTPNLPLFLEMVPEIRIKRDEIGLSGGVGHIKRLTF